MNTLKDWHPDIEEFIEAKTKEEKKAWALIEQGYDGSYNGDAYGSIMYQNENLSVRVSDEFMHAAIDGKEWWTRKVLTGRPCEKKDARSMLRKIAEGTHICGDPGMQFDSTIHRWHTCKGTARQNSTNPCSEYLFLDNTACNLASLNLMKFKRSDGIFDIERFKAAVRLFITAQEIIVDNASYPTKEIAENSHIFRTLGLGFANLGALIMSYGLGYDSDEARALAGSITSMMTGEAYAQSALTAAVTAPFPGYRDSRPFKGERSLHYLGHLRMMAACQPFLSGAISKTVNLPNSATVDEIMNTYIEGWKLGLKAIAIYRDGSKRSAPLNTTKTKDMGTEETPAKDAESEALRQRVAELEKEVGTLRAEVEQPSRRRLPNTRVSLTHKFEIAGHEGYITVGLYESGQPGELFIQMAKEGSTIGGLMDTVATLTSLALQYGVPLESLVKKFAYQRFEPSGFTKNPDIRNATSITD